MNKKTLRRALGAGAVLLALVLTSGCGTSTSSGAATTPKSTSSSSMDHEEGVEVHEAWAKAITEDEMKATPMAMSAAFGILHNHSATDVTVVSATSPVAGRVELHEVVMVDGKMQMQPKKGGFLIKADGSHELKPGSDHIMLMDLKQPLLSGTSIDVTVSLSDGTTVTFSAPVKVFSAGNETYKPSSSTMSGM